MPPLARAFAAALLLTPTACATVNADFTPPGKTSLALGRSTEQDVIAAEGAPQIQTISTRANRYPDRPLFDWAPAKHYDVLRYSFGQAVLGSASVSRQANFFLADGRLAGWTFISDSPAETTNFDVAAAQQLLATGHPTLAEVSAAIGPPSGHLVFPLTSAPTLRMEAWEYAGPDKPSGKRVTKSLNVLVGPDNRVVASYIHQEDTPLPVSRTVVVPIIVR